MVMKFLWVVESGNSVTGDEPARTSYNTEEEATVEAASIAADHAKEELEAIEWDPDSKIPGILKALIAAYKKKDYGEAFELWEEYAYEASPNEYIHVYDVLAPQKGKQGS